MLSTSQLRVAWSPACKLRPSYRFTFWSGVPVTVDGRLKDALTELDKVLKRWGYRPKSGQTWGYNCRRITGGTGYSLHAYGISVDINSLANPYGKRLITDMPRQMVEEILALRTNNGKQVWGWGGNYRTNKDAMHFEIVCTPADLATGIRGALVPSQPASDVLSAGQIKWLAQNVAGLAGEDLVIATALGLAESDGKVTAYHGKGLDASYGIWQINTHGNLGPDRRMKLGLKSNDEFYDPTVNARGMRLVRQEAIAQRKPPWEPWGAFTDGRYLKRMDEARAAQPIPVGEEDDMFTEQDRKDLLFAVARGQETTNMLHGVNGRLDNIAALLEKLVKAAIDAK